MRPRLRIVNDIDEDDDDDDDDDDNGDDDDDDDDDDGDEEWTQTLLIYQATLIVFNTFTNYKEIILIRYGLHFLFEKVKITLRHII